jgi:hypothetical protein
MVTNTRATIDSFYIAFTEDTLCIMKEKGTFRTAYNYDFASDKITFILDGKNYSFKVHNVKNNNIGAVPKKILLDEEDYMLLLEQD